MLPVSFERLTVENIKVTVQLLPVPTERKTRKLKMPYYVLVFFSRKPGRTAAEFESEFEAVMPTIAANTVNSFPVSHTRHYLSRDDNGDVDVINGSQDDFKFDTVSLIEFKDKENYLEFRRERHASEAMKEFDKECFDKLPDQSTMRACVVRDIHVTRAIDFK